MTRLIYSVCPNMKQLGFTLIELLVAIGIILLVVSLGLVNYLKFNDQKKLEQSYELVMQSVADAQNSARSGKMRGCNALLAYEINFTGNLITITPRCANNTSGEINQIELSSGVVFIDNQSLFIQPISGLIFDNLNFQGQDLFVVILNLFKDNTLLTMNITQVGAVTLVEN